MKNIFYIAFLFFLFFLMGSHKSADIAWPLPGNSEWRLMNSDVSLRISGDSLFWTLKSDKPEVPSITVSARYELFPSGKINLTYKLPLLSQDLPYIYGEKSAAIHEHIIHTSSCRLRNNELVLYSSKDDSLVFCRKK